ncbi:hypothetical protein OH768_51205 [Streptomyces sp. NBC_01622]|nr:hypothetical protein OH768_51205 [Streptomyces sp. NBC_01622]
MRAELRVGLDRLAAPAVSERALLPGVSAPRAALRIAPGPGPTIADG